jgi:hypothetical protein
MRCLDCAADFAPVVECGYAIWRLVDRVDDGCHVAASVPAGSTGATCIEWIGDTKLFGSGGYRRSFPGCERSACQACTGAREAIVASDAQSGLMARAIR